MAILEMFRVRKVDPKHPRRDGEGAGRIGWDRKAGAVRFPASCPVPRAALKMIKRCLQDGWPYGAVADSGSIWVFDPD